MNQVDFDYYKTKITASLKTLNPLIIILFGSYAKNEIIEDSDMDFLIVLDENRVPQSYEEKIALKLKVRARLGEITKQIPIDLLVYTIPEYAELKRLNTSFYREIEQTGLVLYEKAG
jgi:uncharacterized protein